MTNLDKIVAKSDEFRKNEQQTKMDMRTEIEVERPAEAFCFSATSAIVSSMATNSIGCIVAVGMLE